MCVAHFFYEEKKEVRRWERESGGVGVDGVSSTFNESELWKKKMYLK
jgi:riboflavin synthase alpha subunit